MSDMLEAPADVLGVVRDATVDGHPADVILLEKGLVVVPSRKSGALLARHSPGELAERHRHVAYVDVAAVRFDRSSPVDATLLLRDGRTMTVRERWTADPDDTFREILSGLRAH